ncbi:hypothetical protein INT45_011472 [Circinella minor]|uniref:Ankyrin repeat-containing protein n=1 Tax=Circinella minor TaxID=1195481 RepID=A0A8H7S2W1_9FUNG|nr:hypothetical protein INT45_011472 [Circinella minor]
MTLSSPPFKNNDIHNTKIQSNFQKSPLSIITATAGTENGRTNNNSNTMVRLVAPGQKNQVEEEEEQEQDNNEMYEMAPSNYSPSNNNNNNNGSTSSNFMDSIQHNDSQRFDISVELPNIDDSIISLMWKSAQMGDLTNLQYALQSSQVVESTQLVNMRNPENECTLLYTVILANDNSSNNNNNNDEDQSQKGKEYPLMPLMELLLDQGADPTALNVYNVQAIHAISLHCREPLEPIELLLKHQVDPNARDGDGWTPMHYISRFYQHDPQEILQLLQRYGANVNAVDVTHKSPLFPLLANGDYANTLDWFIHSAKADLSIRGEFLNQQTRRTNQGTLLLQAAKYARRQCMAVLTNSSIAMETFRIAITQEELNQATLFVRQRLNQISDLKQTDKNYYYDDEDDNDDDNYNNEDDSGSSSSSSSRNDRLNNAYADLDAIATMLEDLRRTLEEDKTSTLATEIRLERTGQQLTRRQSLLGSFRRKSRQQQQLIQQQQQQRDIQFSYLQKPPLAKTKNIISPRLLQDFASMSTASLNTFTSSFQQDKGNHRSNELEDNTMQRRTSLLKRVGNMFMRQKNDTTLTSHA